MLTDRPPMLAAAASASATPLSWIYDVPASVTGTEVSVPGAGRQRLTTTRVSDAE
jgi:tagatose-1,6-bisphosphate aldolase non-catalytic subunit AgaZ/GatZ